MTPTVAVIEQKLRNAFSPTHLTVLDESHKHAGHGSFVGEGGTHFRVTIISAAFEGLTALQRHRLVYDVLKDEMANGLHALAIDAQSTSQG
jgi:BolA family transcriptional regulator, general stress-responsive regulator